GLDKCYEAVIELGAVTPSFDGETEITERRLFDHVTRADIEHVLQLFTGNIEQVPPMYSAIKVKGTPLYKLARRGEELELTPRPVHIENIELTGLNLPELALTIRCSKGTYIRSLAHDIGAELGCGAYLKSLRRTAVGSYSINDAWQLDALVDALQASAPVNRS
ncbi:MAG: tRNA pseudouridine(55) synthase TruB, partial [Saprospiraceae bacterium]|nr:tRNA pseudouridine(55) synthase TruB [Saprospiraceae bacterium]